MNALLQLKGTLHSRKSAGSPGAPGLPKHKFVSIVTLQGLYTQLSQLAQEWESYGFTIDPLISVRYKSVVAKSNRMKALLIEGKDNTIVGIRFSSEGPTQHIITHRISRTAIQKSLHRLALAIDYFRNNYDEIITKEDLEIFTKQKASKLPEGLSKTTFAQIIKDAYYIESFEILEATAEVKGQAIVSLFDIDKDVKTFLQELNLSIDTSKMLDEYTFLLNEHDYNQLVERAPHIVAMESIDVTTLDFDENLGEVTTSNAYPILSVPSPQNEPIIGVIDTLFDRNVYFSEWVEYTKLVSDAISNDEGNNKDNTNQRDKKHGTEVTSLIVDGPQLNPELDDGCGRFRVKHFGVAVDGPNSTFKIIKNIKSIVEQNRDIKVWNVSIGSVHEIYDNFISPEAALLDQLQRDNDVVFVIAGTNKDNRNQKKIGAPADSINGIVVNSVDKKGNPAPYTREGTVLSFFNKPDIAYYGGTDDFWMHVCAGDYGLLIQGTSFAAPWISRKIAYMIHILGLSKETAKALLIDSATSWGGSIHASNQIGYGVVPIRIEDVVYSQPDEIKFIIEGKTEAYDTYAYNIPVPLDQEKFPFIAKATLAYYPNCSRSQGVDYTDTELDIHFGRINKDGRIETINENKQSDEGLILLYEEEARKHYRKWDNVKHIREFFYTETGRKREGKKMLTNELWGLSIKKKERHIQHARVPFSVVITLKEVNGVNRIETFKQQCSLKGWLVQQIDIESRVGLYQKMEEEIELN